MHIKVQSTEYTKKYAGLQYEPYLCLMTVHIEKDITCLWFHWGGWLLFAVMWMLPLASLC